MVVTKKAVQIKEEATSRVSKRKFFSRTIEVGLKKKKKWRSMKGTSPFAELRSSIFPSKKLAVSDPKCYDSAPAVWRLISISFAAGDRLPLIFHPPWSRPSPQKPAAVAVNPDKINPQRRQNHCRLQSRSVLQTRPAKVFLLPGGSEQGNSYTQPNLLFAIRLNLLSTVSATFA